MFVDFSLFIVGYQHAIFLLCSDLLTGMSLDGSVNQIYKATEIDSHGESFMFLRRVKYKDDYVFARFYITMSEYEHVNSNFCWNEEESREASLNMFIYELQCRTTV